jgi:hypothetical protein
MYHVRRYLAKGITRISRCLTYEKLKTIIKDTPRTYQEIATMFRPKTVNIRQTWLLQLLVHRGRDVGWLDKCTQQKYWRRKH